jgi:8-oxo-dGTP pyrophosphatase MutT (NUDIX family)
MSEAGSSEFESLGSEVEWEGKVFRAGRARFRYADGAEVAREKAWHPGAVGILAVDDSTVWLTRQPREVVGEAASLEIPAGKLDVAGEPPLAAAQRELAEEIGQQAEEWSELFAFYTSPGFTDERVRLYLARGLSPAPDAQSQEDERIEIVRWPLDQLDQAISQCEDAKSLVALLWLALGSRAERP